MGCLPSRSNWQLRCLIALGIGLPEPLLIMVIALIVFGPGKLPEIGSALGRAIGDFRRASRELTSDLQESVADVRSAVDQAVGTTQPSPQGTVEPLQQEAPSPASGSDEAAAPAPAPSAEVQRDDGNQPGTDEEAPSTPS